MSNYHLLKWLALGLKFPVLNVEIVLLGRLRALTCMQGALNVITMTGQHFKQSFGLFGAKCARYSC